MLSSIPITLLRKPQIDEELDVQTTLREACAGKVGVIDLWHTKCTRCPAALEKMNEMASEYDSEQVMFIACALSLGSGNKEAVNDYINDWSNMYHIFVEESDKEALKSELGYSAVPFYIVFDENGNTVKTGDSKVVNYQAEITSLLNKSNAENAAPSAAAPQTGAALVFDEDF